MKKMMIYMKKLKEFLFPLKILYYVKTFKKTSLFVLKYLILSKTIQLCTMYVHALKRRIKEESKVGYLKKKKKRGFLKFKIKHFIA